MDKKAKPVKKPPPPKQMKPRPPLKDPEKGKSYA
jgi:hypothetical protein